ncbi:MAG: hypothetical protein R2882_00530 [Gemmatimonadales bacterium]
MLLRIRFGVLEGSPRCCSTSWPAVVSYLVLGPLQEAKGSYPQSDPIAAVARLPVLPDPDSIWGFLVAVDSRFLVFWIVFRRTGWGSGSGAVGEALRAAIAGAIRPDRVLAQSLFCSGALAGLAGAFEVSGVTYALYPSLSPGYGFTAIAVALIAGLHPIGVLVAGIGFGALEAGAAGMQREAGVPAVAVSVVQAVIIAIALVSVSRARGARVEAST